MENSVVLEQLGIDTQVLFGRFCGNEAMAIRFLKSFPSDPNFERLGKALDDNDVKGIEMSAHTMKGVCANLELKSLFELSAGIVSAVREDRLSDVPGLYERLVPEYRRVAALLSQLE